MNSPKQPSSAHQVHDRFFEGMDKLPAGLRDRIASSRDRLDETALDVEGFFTPAESAFLCETFKNADFPLERFDEWPLLLSWDVEDVEKYEKLGVRFDINVPELLEKLEDFTHDQALWLLLAIDRFWRQRKERGEMEEFYTVKL